MRAALMVENDGPLVIEDLVPQGLADHDVEVRIEASGVCRSDQSPCDHPAITQPDQQKSRPLRTGSDLQSYWSG